jgi:hypothetical protein
MFKKTNDEEELEALLESEKESLTSTFTDNFIRQQSTLEIILKARRYAEAHSLKDHIVFWNAAGFVNVSSFDLKVIVMQMTFAKNEWSKRLFARQACHLIYELLSDLFEILGKEFRGHIALLPENENLKIKLKDIVGRLNEFKGKHYNWLQAIRNVSAAHRDKDLLQLFNTIEQISWLESINLVTEFDKSLNDLGALLQVVIDKSTWKED